VVVGAHGRGAVHRLLLGSVADRVVRLAPGPVLTVRRLHEDCGPALPRGETEGEMRRSALVWLLVIALLLLAAGPSHARHHWRGGVFIGVGPVWWGSPYWWGPAYPYWYPPYYPYLPPTVVIEEPPVYIQRAPAPPAPPASWYYCPSVQGYYPYVQTCPEAWVTVPARPQ